MLQNLSILNAFTIDLICFLILCANNSESSK